MTPEGGAWRCKYGVFHRLDDACTCAAAIASHLVPGTSPTDLPADRAGVTVRYVVGADLTPILRARLKHEPAADLTGVTA